jgi:hypothetical protein
VIKSKVFDSIEKELRGLSLVVGAGVVCADATASATGGSQLALPAQVQLVSRHHLGAEEAHAAAPKSPGLFRPHRGTGRFGTRDQVKRLSPAVTIAFLAVVIVP